MVYMEYFEGRERDRGGRNYTHIGCSDRSSDYI